MFFFFLFLQGYLGQTLHKNYGLSVIGLESSAGHSEGAERRAAKQGRHACCTVKPLTYSHLKNLLKVALVLRKETQKHYYARIVVKAQ